MMGSQSPISRGAPFINTADLVRSTPRQSTASEQAKRMMGTGNPLTGKETRAPASTVCPSCGRWHRPGTVCHNMRKAEFNVDALFKGRIITTKPKSGNPYHDAATGRFASSGVVRGEIHAGGGAAHKEEMPASGAATVVHQPQETLAQPTEAEPTPHDLESAEADPSGWGAVARAAQAQQQGHERGSALDKLKEMGAKLKESAPGSKAASGSKAAPDQPHPIQAHELATVLAPGVDPNAVMAQMTPEELQAFGNAVETGQEVEVPSRLAPFFAAYHQPVTAGVSAGQAAGATSDQPAGAAQSAITGLRQAPSLLSQSPAPTAPPDPAQQQKRLAETSQHLQMQNQGYMDRLRQWLSRFTG